MTEWSQAVWIAVGLLIAAFVVSITVYYMSKGMSINNEVSLQEARREAMVEYRTYNGFNDKNVYAQDIVSLVLQYNSQVAVRVMRGTSTVAYWCTNDNIEDSLPNYGWSSFTGAKKTDYTATKVQENLDVNKIYHAELTYGASGEVLGITCKQGTINSSGNFVAD